MSMLSPSYILCRKLIFYMFLSLEIVFLIFALGIILWDSYLSFWANMLRVGFVTSSSSLIIVVFVGFCSEQVAWYVLGWNHSPLPWAVCCVKISIFLVTMFALLISFSSFLLMEWKCSVRCCFKLQIQIVRFSHFNHYIFVFWVLLCLTLIEVWFMSNCRSCDLIFEYLLDCGYMTCISLVRQKLVVVKMVVLWPLLSLLRT